MSEELVTLAPRKVRTPKPPKMDLTPMGMIGIAVQQGASIDQLSRLMDLQERFERGEARKSYIQAMSAFKSDPPEIHKNKLVAYGNTKYHHATLDEVVDKITAALSLHGLSHAWSIQQGEGGITVTCSITHVMGHSESVSMTAPPDASGQKNSIQQIQSTVTYLQRHTLLAITGLATKDQDDETKMPGITSFSDFQDLANSLQTATNNAELQERFASAWKKAAKDQAIQKELKAIYDAKKNVLKNEGAA